MLQPRPLPRVGGHARPSFRLSQPTYQISKELQLRGEGLKTVIPPGNVLVFALCADRRGHAVEASLGQAAPPNPSSLSECTIDQVEEARKCLLEYN